MCVTIFPRGQRDPKTKGKKMTTYTTARGSLAVVADEVLPNMFCAKFQERSLATDAEICVNCGRKVSQKNLGIGIVVIDGGDGICRPEDDAKEQNDSGYMGWWAVGSECIKTVPKEFRTKLRQ